MQTRIYYHSIPACTPQSGYQRVTEDAKSATKAKMAEKGINCMIARPTPSHTNRMESGPGQTCSAQKRKPQTTRLMISDTKKGWCRHFFDIFDPPPTPSPQPRLKKMGFKWGALGEAGSRPKTRWGMRSLDKILIL